MIPILLIVLIFSLISCSTPKQVTLTATIPIIVEPTTAATTTAAVGRAAFNQIKTMVEGNKGSLTKITFSNDGLTLYLAYNSKWAEPDMVKKEMFDYITNLAVNNSNFNIDINAADAVGTTYHSYTSTENMVKIKNLKMSYDDWLDAMGWQSATTAATVSEAPDYKTLNFRGADLFCTGPNMLL